MTGSFTLHRNFGYVFGLLTLALVAFALVGRLPRGVIVGSAVVLVLFAFQSVFVLLRPSMPAIAALHPLKGFAVLALGLWLAWTTRGRLWRRAKAA